jgi:hypothetical protein
MFNRKMWSFIPSHKGRGFRTTKMEISDWAETDDKCRALANKVLNYDAVHGDCWGVPCIEDLVEMLVEKILKQNA